MSSEKKIKPVVDDQTNTRIQSKFDDVYLDKTSANTVIFEENSSDELENSLNFSADEMVLERNDGNKKNKSAIPQINFDLANEEVIPEIPESVIESNSMGKSHNKTSTSAEHAGFTIEDSDIGDLDHKLDITGKTVVAHTAMVEKANLQDFSLEKTGSSSIPLEMMTNEEVKANIESTIKNILRPSLEEATDVDLSNKGPRGIGTIEDSVLDLGNTSLKGLSLSDINNATFSLDLSDHKEDLSVSKNEIERGLDFDIPKISSNDATTEFDLNAIEDFSAAEDQSTEVEMPSNSKVEMKPELGLNTEESIRYQATIRALRQEREEMLLQIKNLKGDSKELEQDNLTLKANLDEAKIEISILRKRHMAEIEDYKYRANLSEEKKMLAEEKAKQADIRREKLEQKVRIDFNQVKQREKELESKLELLSMDVDAQVQSRDQKILELRRKIDALEFNMENASIKEQKSLDDKHKLEDRLNKIMKTLRHSIQNLEDDIEQAEDRDDWHKDKS